MYYFAYGSNMALARLQRRLPTAERIGAGRLDGYLLQFNVVSTQDGSAKCNAVHTGCPEHQVLGALFRIEPEAKLILDLYEGVGVEYRAAQVEVKLFGGGAADSLIYLGENLAETVRPYHWYKEHVFRGAIENGLPEAYISRIQAVDSVADPNRGRAETELSIYR